MRAFINEQDVARAAAELNGAAHKLKARLKELESTMQDISSDSGQIEKDIQLGADSLNLDDLLNLYADVEMLTKKIGADYEDLLRLPDNQKSVPTASRRALIHTRDLLPSLQKLITEISQYAHQAAVQRNTCLEASTRALRTISIIQSGLGDFQSRMSSLGLFSEGTEAYDIIHAVFDIPLAYGSTLVESIRRSEWIEGLKSVADHVTQNLKAYEHDELRRRKKWMKSMEGMINDAPEEISLGVDVRIEKPSNPWPTSSREEVFEYIEALRLAHIDEAVLQLTHLLKELDSSKPRQKGARAFKGGSVYDADLGLGRSSLLMEEDDEVTRTLRGEKSRLEDRLKASDSRVRKLEDLLHRHTQMNRPAGMNFGPQNLDADRPPQSTVALPSPRSGELVSRRSSVSSRRLSSNQNPEERTLVQRIVNLEADLRAERENALKVQREAQADRRTSTEIRDRVQEAESTKKDLLANLEAQRQEFDDERQILEDEIHKLKIRLEEVEDEFDRVLGSRDHQKLSSENAIVELQGSWNASVERVGRRLPKLKGKPITFGTTLFSKEIAEIVLKSSFCWPRKSCRRCGVKISVLQIRNVTEQQTCSSTSLRFR